MADAENRFNQLKITLKSGHFEVYQHKDFGVSPSWVFGGSGGYAQWLMPIRGTKQHLVDAGLNDVQATQVMRALAEGRETNLTFDLPL